MTLPIFAAERRRPHDRHILPAKRSAANPLAAVAIVDRRVRQTDRRTDARAFHVDGSCAEHFNCRILYDLYLPTVILTIIWYSITHSLFHSRLKTFLFCKSFPPQYFLFFFFRTHYMDSPDCLLLFLSISVFYF